MDKSLDLSQISDRIERTDRLQCLRESIAQLISRRRTSFPGAQPVTFARRHLQELQPRMYSVCEKSDGVRFLLYLRAESDIRGTLTQEQFFVDRKNQFHSLRKDVLSMPSKGNGRFKACTWHKGTLLDGELVREVSRSGKSRLVYLLFDCLAVEGINLTNHKYRERREHLEERFFRPWELYTEEVDDRERASPLKLALKVLRPLHDIKLIFEDILPNLLHPSDGLIFACDMAPYKFGTDNQTIKWKRPKDNTVDFRLHLDHDPPGTSDPVRLGLPGIRSSYHLHVRLQSRSYSHFAPLHLNDGELEKLSELSRNVRSPVIECFQERGSGFWRPKVTLEGEYAIRHDKSHANHLHVVKEIMAVTQDEVTEKELITRFSMSRISSGKERKE